VRCNESVQIHAHTVFAPRPGRGGADTLTLS